MRKIVEVPFEVPYMSDSQISLYARNLNEKYA